MSWRTVVVTGMAKLDYRMDYLVVRKKTETVRIHLSEIGILMIESTLVSLTTTLVSELIRHKVKIIICDQKHNPCAEVMPYYGSHDTSAKIRIQINWDGETRKQVGTKIITEKLHRQREYLEELSCIKEAKLLIEYIKSIEIGDPTNREAHAAKIYFPAVFGSGFSRNQDNSVNAALNYGYGILLAMFNREIVSNGYITQIGLFHDNMFNQFNLASDLMEPFRILVDRKVAAIKPKKFDQEEKTKILELINEQVYIGKQHRYLEGAVGVYCKSVFEAMEHHNPNLIKPYSYEL